MVSLWGFLRHSLTYVDIDGPGQEATCTFQAFCGSHFFHWVQFQGLYLQGNQTLFESHVWLSIFFAKEV